MTPPPPPETFPVVLESAAALTPRVRRLTFARADSRPFAFQAGQWVSLVLPTVRRSYSLASPPDGSPRFEVAVTKVDGGPGSTFLHALEPGATLEAKGPQGTFTRPLDGAPPSLFVGTGTGLAPLRAMVKDALAHGRTEPLVVLLGVRTLADALYLGELQALAQAHPCLSVALTLSRPEDGWTGRRGYVQEHAGALWDALATQGTPHAWVCGLKKMAVATREVLKARGVERQRLHVEAYD